MISSCLEDIKPLNSRAAKRPEFKWLLYWKKAIMSRYGFLQCASKLRKPNTETGFQFCFCLSVFIDADKDKGNLFDNCSLDKGSPS